MRRLMKDSVVCITVNSLSSIARMKLCLSAATIVLLSITHHGQNAQIPITINQFLDKIQSNNESYWGLENELTKESRLFDKVAKSKLLFKGHRHFNRLGRY
ncbi:MAG: hypothetical protein ACI97X_001906 [Oceanospirillaceae bacterium]|jgi:hypothetical protein